MINDFQQELLKKLREGLKPSDLKAEKPPTKNISPADNILLKPAKKTSNQPTTTNNNQSLLTTELLLILGSLAIAGYYLLLKE